MVARHLPAKRYAPFKNIDSMNYTKSQIKLALTILFIFIAIFRGNSQNGLIHNTDKNTLVNFSEALNYLQNIVDSKLKGKVYTVTGVNYGYLLIVKSMDECRDISAEKKEFLDYAFKTIGAYGKAKNLFNKEVFVETDTGNYWFPIQDGLLSYWQEELKKNDLALIYIRFYGSMSNTQKDKLIFTINGFNSNYYDGLWEEALNNFNDGKDTIGLRCVNKLMAFDPKDGRNYALKGFYYTSLGKKNLNDLSAFTKADSLFSIAEELTPNYSYQYFQRAILKFYLHDYPLSWKYIEKAKSMNEDKIEQNFVDDLESKLPYEEYIKTKK